jgi:hypothetical protein
VVEEHVDGVVEEIGDPLERAQVAGGGVGDLDDALGRQRRDLRRVGICAPVGT